MVRSVLNARRMLNLNKIFPWLSIRSKLIIAFVGLSVVPVALVGLHGIFSNVSMMEKIAYENLTHDVQTIREKTANFLAAVESDLHLLNNSSNLQRLVKAMDDSPNVVPSRALQQVSADLVSFAETKAVYYQVRIVNEQGNELLRVERIDDPGSVHPHNVVINSEVRSGHSSFYFLLVQNLDRNDIAFTPAELVDTHNERIPVISFALPLFGSKGRVGILIANVFAKDLFQVIETKRHLDVNGKVVLVNNEGHYLYHSEKKKDWNKLLASRGEDNLQHDYPPAVVSLLLSGKEGTLTEGVDEIISYGPLFFARGHVPRNSAIRGFIVPLYIFESVPKAVILGPVTTFAWTFAGFLILFLVTAIGLGVLATQQFTKPIAALQHGAEIIAKGNYGHRLDVETHDEIEKLASQFNVMAASLESHEQEIQHHRMRLEEMVRLRTRELTEEKSKLQAILDNVPSAFVLLDREFRIQTASAAFGAVTGFSFEDVRGKDCQTVFCKDGFCQECVCREALQKGGIASHIDRADDRGGGERFIEHIAVPMKEDGQFTSILEIITDVTKRKRLEQHIVQTEKLMAAGEMSAIIAHEFRNSLTSIKMILQLQKEARSLSKSDEKSLSVALDSIYHMEEVVAELLNFARPSPMGLRWEHLNNIVNDSLAFVHVHLTTHHIVLDKKLDLTLPPMLIDPTHLKEALVNMLLNAVQAITGGRARAGDRKMSISTKRIRVRKTFRDLGFIESSESPSVEAEGDGGREIVLRSGTECAVIEVSDAGPSIERDVLGRIFDPFFTTKATGTGLGLPMVKRTVNAHGGIVTVSSRPGKSTTFRIILPLRDNPRLELAESKENLIHHPPTHRVSKSGS